MMPDFPTPPALAQTDDPSGQPVDVALYRLQGERELGYLLDFDRDHTRVTVMTRRGEPLTVPFTELRYLYFLRPLTITSSGEAAHDLLPLRRCQISFQDGKHLQMWIRDAIHESCGWHLFQENDASLRRIFVPDQVIARHDLAAEDPPAKPHPPPAAPDAAQTVQLQSILRGTISSQAELFAGLDQLEHYGSAMGEQRKAHDGERIGELLERAGAVTDEGLHRGLATKFGLLFVKLQDFDIDPAATALLPSELAYKHHMLPLAIHDKRLIAAMENPLDSEAIQLLAFNANRRVQIVVAARQDIEQTLGRVYDLKKHSAALEELDIITAEEMPPEDERAADLERIGQDKPMVRLVDAIIRDAVRRGVSDIHIRPEETEVTLLFRIDGGLLPIRTLNKALLRGLVSRVKIIGGMDISTHRLPQDGQARVREGENPVDLRISVIPTINGESVVIRILNAHMGLKGVTEIGLSDPDQASFLEMLHKSSGLILVTGPTGSGKTTTLYSAVHELLEQHLSIITIEEPVEYRLRGIEQIPVNNTAGLTFARALRNILRHDPDAIMVGEIRDRETAQIALESALTGHLVLSTLHTNSAAATVTRLLEMGIDAFLLNSTLSGVLAQRLLRRNCPHCLGEETVTQYLRNTLNVKEDEVFYCGKGCGQCNGLGYHGRMVTYELLRSTPALRRQIAEGSDGDVLHLQAVQDGMVPLTQHALSLARRKLTALQEVYRTRLA